MGTLWLRKQTVIMYFSRSFLACSFMLRPMIFLTLNAAIFHKFAGGTHLQCYVISRCFAARRTAQHRGGCLLVDSAHNIQSAIANPSCFHSKMYCMESAMEMGLNPREEPVLIDSKSALASGHDEVFFDSPDGLRQPTALLLLTD